MVTAQTSEIVGAGNVVVQVAGDGNTIAVGYPYLRLTLYANRRLETLPDPTETDLLRPYSCSVDVLGRDDVLTEYWGWLRDDRAISVRVVTGSAGRGKTRLALELCEQATPLDWRAGFMTSGELLRFQAQQNAAEWGWNAPTLVVIDYAATNATRLQDWLHELSDHAAIGNPEAGLPLRILLVERQAEQNTGWWSTVFGGGDDTSRAVARLLDPPDPLPLPPLEGDEVRRSVLTEMLERLGSDLRVPELGDDPYFDRRLSELSWGGEPLFLMMAALLASRSGFAAVLSLERDDLALRMADRELSRIKQFAESREVDGSFANHMAAVATLCGGLTREAARVVIGREKEELGHDKVDRAIALSVLQEALFHPDGQVAAIEPDMVGEAALLRVLGGHEGQDGVPVVLRALADAQTAVVPVVIRTCQDYAIHGHVAPLAWLDALGDATVDELPLLLGLLNALPQDTITLRERALSLEEAATGAFRKLAQSGEPASLDNLATNLNHISNRLSALGRHDEALTANEEAVGIHRGLAARHPDAYRPDLAMSLNNMSNRLSTLGRHDEALAAVEEAVGIRRELAARHPDAYRPTLAKSLVVSA